VGEVVCRKIDRETVRGSLTDRGKVRGGRRFVGISKAFPATISTGKGYQFPFVDAVAAPGEVAGLVMSPKSSLWDRSDFAEEIAEGFTPRSLGHFAPMHP